MEYVYMNLTSIFMYVGSGTEIWECIQTHTGEFYHPMNLGNIYAGKVKFTAPLPLPALAGYRGEHTPFDAVDDGFYKVTMQYYAS